MSTVVCGPHGSESESEEPQLGARLGSGNNGVVFQSPTHADRVIKRTWLWSEYYDLMQANEVAPGVSPACYGLQMYQATAYIEMQKIEGPTLDMFLKVRHSVEEWSSCDEKLERFARFMSRPQRFEYLDWKLNNIMMGPAGLVLVDWANCEFSDEPVFRNYMGLRALFERRFDALWGKLPKTAALDASILKDAH